MENKTRVLLLENDLLIAHEVEHCLRQAGFIDVHVGGNCTYAMTWLATHTPALAIVDPHLADGRCREVFELLRSKSVPFIVYAHDYVTTIKRHDARGGQWVLKPASREVLLRAVDTAFSSLGLITGVSERSS
jgi:DNA-binding response OmpR family regulator